jgi:hypothetical protein
VTSPALVLSGFRVTGPGPSDQVDSVTATVNCWASGITAGPLGYELHDGKTGALLGTTTGTASTSPAHSDQVTFPAPSWAALYWLQLQIFASPGSAPSGTTVSVDYAALSVTYVPSGIPFAAPVAGAATAAGTAPDASGPRGRNQADITVLAGPTVSRAQVLSAGDTAGDGTRAGPTQGDGTGASGVLTRESMMAGAS